MKIGAIKDLSLVDGPGARLTIFFTGCEHNCSECHNPDFQKYNYGVEWSIPDLIDYIKDRSLWLDGISLSGGDPVFQPELREFLETIRRDPELKKINIWMWTGYLFEDIPNYIKSKLNVIIDGKYDNTQQGAAWRGSKNQRVWKHVVGHHFEEVAETDIIWLSTEVNENAKAKKR